MIRPSAELVDGALVELGALVARAGSDCESAALDVLRDAVTPRPACKDVRQPCIASTARTARVRLTFGFLCVLAVLVLHDLGAAIGVLILGYLVETER